MNKYASLYINTMEKLSLSPADEKEKIEMRNKILLDDPPSSKLPTTSATRADGNFNDPVSSDKFNYTKARTSGNEMSQGRLARLSNPSVSLTQNRQVPNQKYEPYAAGITYPSSFTGDHEKAKAPIINIEDPSVLARTLLNLEGKNPQQRYHLNKLIESENASYSVGEGGRLDTPVLTSYGDSIKGFLPEGLTARQDANYKRLIKENPENENFLYDLSNRDRVANGLVNTKSPLLSEGSPSAIASLADRTVNSFSPASNIIEITPRGGKIFTPAQLRDATIASYSTDSWPHYIRDKYNGFQSGSSYLRELGSPNGYDQDTSIHEGNHSILTANTPKLNLSQANLLDQRQEEIKKNGLDQEMGYQYYNKEEASQGALGFLNPLRYITGKDLNTPEEVGQLLDQFEGNPELINKVLTPEQARYLRQYLDKRNSPEKKEWADEMKRYLQYHSQTMANRDQAPRILS